MDSGPGDETLLLAVAERDMGAFRTLYERHAGWLAIRLARRCNDRDLVADAIGDTFVAVWQKPRGFGAWPTMEPFWALAGLPAPRYRPKRFGCVSIAGACTCNGLVALGGLVVVVPLPCVLCRLSSWRMMRRPTGAAKISPIPATGGS